MSLLDELKEQRRQAVSALEMQQAYVIAHQSNVDDWHLRIADIDTAIAALEPAPLTAEEIADVAEFVAEQETAREQLEREDVGMVETFNEFQAELASQPDPDEQDDASEFAEPLWQLHELAQDEICAVPSKALGEAVAAWGNAQFAPRDEFDPSIKFVVEPWEGSAEGHAVDIAASWQSMYGHNVGGEPIDWLGNPPPVTARSLPERTLPPEAPALNADMQDEREEPVALAQPEWNEPVTSEAKMFSHGIQSEQKPERKFDPWGGVSNLFGKPKVDA